MACDKRKQTGICGHYQCPYSGLTDHGYECLGIFGHFCEEGLDCISECSFSWTEKDRPRVEAAVKIIFPEEFGEGV